MQYRLSLLYCHCFFFFRANNIIRMVVPVSFHLNFSGRFTIVLSAFYLSVISMWMESGSSGIQVFSS